jgi:FolB domain-containing protein
MDKILIQNLSVEGILGVYERERTTPRKILINVTLFTDTHDCAQTDTLDNCVDYSQVAKDIRDHVKKSKRFTVEALAEDIARLCLDRAGVHGVKVRVDKPGAIKDVETVGVEIERGI